jgi:hypothetical protein
MKKKLLILGIVLALVAALVIPTAVFAAPPTTTQAPTTTAIVVTGTDAAPTVTFTAPGSVNLNNTNDMMMAGWNVATGGAGSVALTEGTSNNATWTVTAESSSPYMNNTSVNLQNFLLLGNSNATGASWYIANGSVTQYWVPTVINAGSSDTAVYSAAGPLTYSGKTLTAPIPFYAAQYVTPTDALGNYTATITFTASCMP